MLFFLLALAHGYQETITFISLDAYNTISILNFTDSLAVSSISPFTHLNTFPISILELLEKTSSFSAILTWGTPETLKPRLSDYTSKTGRKLQLSQPGLSIFATTQNWSDFINKLSITLTLAALPASTRPIELPASLFWHSNDFLCVENLKKLESLLPCRGKGLTSLLDQLATSKYLSVSLQASRNTLASSLLENYSYSIVITALRKEQYSGVLSQCNTSVEIFEEGLEEYTSSLRLSKLALSPVKAKSQPEILSLRSLQDEEHGFTARFFHTLSNTSKNPIKVSIIEHFNKALVPLLSTFSHRPAVFTRYTEGWVAKFEVEVAPGQEVVISLSLNKKILGFEEYPTDPQRGWDILPMPFYWNDQVDVSNALLVMIPEPDFSMPFNVICITGTVIAFFFTSLQSIQTWKDAAHWSGEEYETTIVKARKTMNLLRNVVLAVCLTVLYILDRQGIVKMFG